MSYSDSGRGDSSTPRFGVPTRSISELTPPDLRSNRAGEAAGVWHSILSMVDQFRISDIGFKGGKLWVGIGKRVYTLLEPGVLSTELYMALIDALMQERPKIREAIKKDYRVEQDFSCEMMDAENRRPIRFRANFCYSGGMPAVVLRPLPDVVPTPEAIGLEHDLMERVLMLRRGIILMAGTTNSGKSTTIAAMLEGFNLRHNYHIVTLEDPVEIRFKDRMSVFMQREIGEESLSFEAGLRAAMRQAPHIIVVGEMRDYETIRTACLAAETGHIVITTTHADGVAMAASRLVDTAPPGKDHELRKLLSKSLKLVMYQTLPRRIAEEGGGRLCLREVLWVDGPAANMIASGRDKTLNDHMNSTERLGNKLFAKAFREAQHYLDPEDAAVLSSSFSEQLGG